MPRKWFYVVPILAIIALLAWNASLSSRLESSEKRAEQACEDSNQLRTSLRSAGVILSEALYPTPGPPNSVRLLQRRSFVNAFNLSFRSIDC
jgi:hypothetical protein